MAKPRILAVWQVWLIIASLVIVPVSITYALFSSQAQVLTEESIPASPLNLTSVNQPQQHLDAYAEMLGEMQARIINLDAQTERLAKLAGNSKDVKENIATLKAERLDIGGPLELTAPNSEVGLKKNIDKLLSLIEYQTEYLATVEAGLLQESVYKDMLPNSSPVAASYRSSSYGWRRDPFTKRRAFHSGLDFTARSGTPIFAAGDGVVTFSKRTPGYGRLVKIDHGSGLETRYAHASKLLVKVGDRISKGQVIAKVGSTGRSTGPHLHYEIRLNGAALDPRKYLKKQH
jgi:murein DD-endopeptidase MepM/ murein hydrolase activator NlpD